MILERLSIRTVPRHNQGDRPPFLILAADKALTWGQVRDGIQPVWKQGTLTTWSLFAGKKAMR